ncbi:MAG: energy transducer TonB, partial [Gammaproteobacteria bacterium]|nr:energy transducer TonB [Gammaproteobacteria bacterium]
FGMALCLAILFHAIIILGVGFAPEDPLQPRFDAMEIVLVQQSSDAPEDPQLLAQANLEGGGDSPTPERPATPLSTPMPEVAAAAATQPVPADDPVQFEQIVEQAAPAPQAVAEAAPPAPPAAQAPPIIAAETDTPEQPLPAPPAAAPAPDIPAEHTAVQTRPSRAVPTASELIASSFAIASLSAEIQQRLDARSERPRRKFISASTREYRYAAYMESWRAKVERVGNLNYPDEARRMHLSGNLILEVVIKPDGSVKEMIVRRSSGHQLLDDAAQRIVELASPFAPFPIDIAKDVDLLHVTRTWQFLDSDRFSGR